MCYFCKKTSSIWERMNWDDLDSATGCKFIIDWIQTSCKNERWFLDFLRSKKKMISGLCAQTAARGLQMADRSKWLGCRWILNAVFSFCLFFRWKCTIHKLLNKMEFLCEQKLITFYILLSYQKATASQQPHRTENNKSQIRDKIKASQNALVNRCAGPWRKG